VCEEDELSLLLERGNYCVRIVQVGNYALDVWIEGPNGDSDVILTSPGGLGLVIDELFEDNYAELGLSVGMEV
jgi:hypothetical protein